MLKLFAALSLSVVCNYFDAPTKLFLNLYLAKFLDNSKPTFSIHSVYSIYSV